ncbi:MAG: aromatic ring-hydroxylating dioxygenase subunit alpha [Gammaproteobacteria bacterium]|nr:aromatic ring-hydroxylating dioxygenase subunit alpha [Gammaproteobacteria bacterium]
MSAVEGRWPASPSYSDYLRADSHPVPEFLLQESRRDFGCAPLAVERYTSQTFFDREAERLWPRVWQMVCREEELREVGDAIVYEIVGKSFIVLRSAPGSIRAFYNSCPHRGRKLLDGPGRLSRLRCAFHGFRWRLDGCVESIPCEGDFAHVAAGDFDLPEARVACWGGFVFLNMDRNAPALEDYLGVLPAHFARWRLEDRYKAVHVGKVIACNWKVAQEAFMESYHVIATHPQILKFCADANSRYDILGDNVNRNLTAFGAPSPHLGAAVEESATVDGMLEMLGRKRDAAPQNRTPGASAGGSPRATLGALVRRSFSRTYAGDWSRATDAELLDAMVYNVFPNFSPWGGFAPNIVYRWRPNGRDVASCLMEVMILKPLGVGAVRPDPAPLRLLGPDEPWSSVAELPILGPVIDQDMQNMPLVQQGLAASGTGRVQLGRYQESRIRHFHARMDALLAD